MISPEFMSAAGDELKLRTVRMNSRSPEKRPALSPNPPPTCGPPQPRRPIGGLRRGYMVRVGIGFRLGSGFGSGGELGWLGLR